MTVEVAVPKLSATMEEAKVLAWRKAPGEAVAAGEVIVELETDKAALEVEATVSGVLAERCAEEGATVPVGAPLARIAPPAPAAPAAAAPAEGGADAARAAGAAAAAPRTAPRLEEATAAAVPPAPTGGGAGPMPALRRPRPAAPPALRASPLARRIARARGIALEGLAGSGPGGRILRRDVEGAAASAPAAAAAPPPAPAAPAGAGAPEGTVASRMRQAIAAQVAESRRTIPAFALDRWVDLGLAEDMRAAFNRRPGAAQRLTLTDMLLQALADVLPRHPILAARWEDGAPPRILPAPGLAVGLAVALDEGLMIPVIDLAGAGLDALAARRAAAVAQARAGRLAAAGRTTLTLSNLGAAGADRFEAIINPGETAILAVGRMREAVVAQGGAIRIARGATLTLSVDHRLVDGRTGAAFLADLAARLEGGGWRA